jgi:hypothetical protein
MTGCMDGSGQPDRRPACADFPQAGHLLHARAAYRAGNAPSNSLTVLRSNATLHGIGGRAKQRLDRVGGP